MAAHDPRQSMELTGAASQSINRILGHIEWQRLPVKYRPGKPHNQQSAGTPKAICLAWGVVVTLMCGSGSSRSLVI